MAIGVYRALKQKNIQIGEEIVVASFDNMRQSQTSPLA